MSSMIIKYSILSVKSFEFEKLINFMVNINSHFFEVSEMWFSKSIRLPMTLYLFPLSFVLVCFHMCLKTQPRLYPHKVALFSSSLNYVCSSFSAFSYLSAHDMLVVSSTPDNMVCLLFCLFLFMCFLFLPQCRIFCIFTFHQVWQIIFS